MDENKPLDVEMPVVPEAPQPIPEVTQAVPEVSQAERSTATTPTPTKAKPNTLLVVALVILGILLVGGGAYAFVSAQKKATQKQKENIEVDEDSETKKGLVVQPAEEKKEEKKEEVKEKAVSKKGIVANKIFYVNSGNIFSYDIQTKKTVQWTSYTDTSHHINLNGANVIDEKTLGFSRCATVTGDFACGLYTLNLETKSIIERKKLAKDEFLLTSGFATETKFAYLYTKGEKWILALYDGGSVKNLEEVDIPEAYGRGGFIEDSEKIAFSPDQKYVVYVSTGSPRGNMDFNVYVYNLAENSKDIIKDATQPQWLDSGSIIYRRYMANGGSENGLYVYDVKTKTSGKISGLMSSSYLPNVLLGTKKIVYNNYPDKQVWLFEKANGKNVKLSDWALDPIWVNESSVAFTSVEECSGGECDGMSDYNVLGISVFDLKTNKATLIPGLNAMGPLVTEYK